MANDFKQKEPTKTEKVLYELMMRQEMTDRNLWTTSAHVIGLGMLLDIKPEQVADLLVNGQDKIKEYGQKINEAIEKLEKERKKTQPEEQEHNHAGHDHGHNHSH
ncbi:MAG: hypothetical protein M1333_00555 [Patescibacteria group bacterium]|nr:hypothetical protein [Patescibacteria group bacterium]